MSEPIRILHVLGRLDRGGTETMIMNLYRNIDKDQIQFDFVIHTDDKCEFHDEIKQLGGRIYQIPRYNGKNHFVYKKSWKNLLSANSEYRIIHGHMRSTASIYLKIANDMGLITIAHSHSIASRGNWLERFVKNMLQYPLRFIADYKFACSLEAGKWLFGDRIQYNKQFYIIKNAIDAQLFTFNKHIRTKIREKYNLKEKYVLGHVGNFTPPKNHQFLLERLVDVLKIKPNAILLLIGDGELKNKIKRKSVNLGIGNKVIIVKATNNVNEFLQAMDVFLFPSFFEGLGMAAIEAQTAGLPCILSNKIPNEASITNLVIKLPLQSIDTWNTSILNFADFKRESQVNVIQENGYDILEQSSKIRKIYHKMIEDDL